MGYLSDYAANNGIDVITSNAISLFGTEATRRQVELQRDVYEDREDLTNVLDIDQMKAKEKGEPFAPNLDLAKERGESLLHFAISHRLRGAYACYKVGDEMECIRHILVALGSVCYAIGWSKASAYLNEQNRILFAMKKAEEAA